MRFVPCFRSTRPDHEVVPEGGVQVALSVLSSIVEIATSSDATPVTVTFSDAMTVSFGGERMETWGGALSPPGGVWTATHLPRPDVNPCESRTSNLTKYAPAREKTCSMGRAEDHGVSHTPAPSQSL